METIKHLTTVQAIGIILLVVGLALRYWMNRRRFDRTIATGLQRYKNYEHKTILFYIELTVRLMAWTLILLGLFFLGIECFNNHRAAHYKQQKQRVATAQHFINPQNLK
jgi:hypothetical protein